MKKLFAALTLFASFAVCAATVQTTFNAEVKFNRADGKVKKLAKVRVITRHNSEANILRPSTLEDCEISAGKEDLRSLFTPADAYTCIATKNTLMMASETLQSIVDRSITMSIFTSNELLDTLQNMIDNGRISNDMSGSVANTVLNRLARDILGAQTTEFMRLDSATTFKIEDERGLESFDVKLSIKKVEYLN